MKDLTAERAASGKSKRLAAHELLREIVGIIPMQPEQRCRRIDLLLDYAKTARQEALREAAKEVRTQKADDKVADDLNQTLSFDTYNMTLESIASALDRLASEGG